MRLLFSLFFVLAILPINPEPGGGTIPPIAGQRLLIIGDSLTSGLFASGEQESFAAMVASGTGMHLARHHAAKLSDAIAVWKTYRDWQPNLVVIEVGLNDVSGGVWAAESWRAAYLSLVQDIQSSGAQIVVCTTFWGGIEPTHRNYQIYSQLNDDIRSVASESGAMLADLWADTNGCQECVSRPGDVAAWPPFLGDNFHPSDHGHAVIAKTILDALGVNRMYFPVVTGG